MSTDKSDFNSKLLDHIDNQEVRNKIYEEIFYFPFTMESKEFTELLEKLLEFPDGVQAIKNNWRILLNNSKKPLETLDVYRKNADIAKDVVSDIPHLIKYSNIDDTGILAKELSLFEGGKEEIAQNFDSLLKSCFTNYDIIFCSALQTEDGRNRAKQNFEKIKLEAPVYEFFNFIKSLKGIEGFEKEYEDYSYWAELYDQTQINIPKEPRSISEILYILGPEEAKKILDLKGAKGIKDIIFDGIINSEDREEKKIILQNVAGEDEYSFKSVGTSSFVIKSNDKVVKLGKGRRKFELPYHPRIMMPYFRKKYSDESILEVYDFGDIENAKITDEELLKIYKELENDGILWGDARKENLLVLEKDGELPKYIKNHNIEILGLIEGAEYPPEDYKLAKKGDVVICDLDFLYYKDDPDYRIGLLDPVIEDYINSKKAEELEESEKPKDLDNGR